MSADPAPFGRIALVGVGLIGGSIGLAARARWPQARIVGVDRAGVLDEALRRGAIDEAAADLAGVSDADLVVLAAPVAQNIALLGPLAPHVAGGAVVTDTGSTKREVTAAGAGALGQRFIGSHPLGGAAAGGIGHARADLFHGRPWILTPTSGADQRRLLALRHFVTALGSTVHTMPADEHDRVLAFVSHLPQLTASALMAVVGTAVGPGGLALAGGGLADTTRLAASPADIWRDIAHTNADQIGPALDALIGALQELRSDLGRGIRLDELFTQAAGWRARLAGRAQL